MNKEFIVPTGKIIKEYLEESNISQKELCAKLGMSERHISNLLNGKTRITEEFAINLELVLPKVPASYWLNYEAKYRECLAREEKELELRKINLEEISKRFCFKEVFANLELTLYEQAKEMLRLLKISDFNNFDATYSNLEVNFMEDGGKIEPIAIWLNLCESEIEIQNLDLTDVKYDCNELKKALDKFKLIATNSDIKLSMNSCRKLCNKLGIYLVICEAITNSKVRGALSSYNGHPAIFLSGRFKTHDNIWFAFIHEIAHLLYDYDKKNTIVSFEQLENDENQKEITANTFARDFFINPEDFKKFVSKSNFTEKSIREFAKSQIVLPGIVVARLQHDKYIKYGQLAYLK